MIMQYLALALINVSKRCLRKIIVIIYGSYLAALQLSGLLLSVLFVI